MTITPLSPSLITASVRRRYLTGTGHASPTAIVRNLEHRMPDHPADRIQGGQNQRPAGHSTVVLSGTDKIRSSTGGKFPIDRHQRRCELPRSFLPRGFSDACLRAPPLASDWQASENP
jgi:hypothetical protein